jgi:hypothetical protein
VLLALTVVAAPCALVLESLLRGLLFPPDFDEFRGFLRPYLAPVGWALCALALAMTAAGLPLQSRMVARRLARLPEAAPPDARYREALSVFMVTAAIPQLPAVASTIAYMLGAPAVPVMVGVTVSTAGVLAQALRVRPLARCTVPGS